ncbi:MAG: PH domain-containing protein [Chthoniobacteraceae bacterium]
MPEETIWTGHSSHIKYFWSYVMSALLALVIAGGVVFGMLQYQWPWYLLALAMLPILMAFWKSLRVRSRVFHLTTERLLLTEGILNKATDSLELYRVRDLRVLQPLWQRMFGLETIQLDTTDDDTPHILVDYIPADLRLADKFREQVEACRVKKGVRDLDVDLPPQ